MGISYPKVERAAVDGFLKVYNQGGLHLLFDNTSRQAMQDFANIVLKSYVDDLVTKAKAAQAVVKAKQEQSVHAFTAEPVVETKSIPAKSSIILTD